MEGRSEERVAGAVVRPHALNTLRSTLAIVGAGARGSGAGRRGQARWAAPLGLLLLGLLAWAAWQQSADAPATRALEPAREHPRGEEPPTREGPLSPVRIGQEAAPPRPYERTRPVLPRYEGEGSLRGTVRAPARVTVPLPLRIRVVPAGKPEAEPRLFEGGPDFEFPDLPLGLYDVRVEATGMNPSLTTVRLSTAAPSPYVVLKVSPMGSLDGFVVRADGAPAEDVRVELRRADGSLRLVERTRATGHYRFDRVPDGELVIRFGPEGQPLVPEREVAYQAPSLQFPEVQLPPAADVLLHTVDAAGRPVPDVKLVGFGRPAGRLDATSDGTGEVRARNLLPGRYRVAATTEDGRSGRLTMEVELREGLEFWVVVR